MITDAPGVDLARLTGWMDDHGLGRGPLTDVEVITGGTQNVLLRFRRDERAYVLRRPPLHKRANSDETMRREARMLAALAGSDVPHPGLIAACPETDVIGAAFYLMEPVDGFNPMEALPERHRSDPTLQHRMGLAMAEALAALGVVDPVAAGLADLGRADGWLERQVDRWRSHLAGYAPAPGYPGPELPGVEEVASWLDAHRPAAWTPGLIHGDFHFGNVLVRHDSGELAAVVDWELATIGDPLLDLGHLLATWPDPGRPGAPIAFDAPGLPSADEVVERYGTRSRRDLSAVVWYRVLACYRLGIILEGTNARAHAGHAPAETGVRLHRAAVALFDQAQELIAG